MKEPDRSDALCGSQVLQIHQKCDGIKAQEVLSQCSESPQILHQLHVQASIHKDPSPDRAEACTQDLQAEEAQTEVIGLGIGVGGQSRHNLQAQKS